MTARARDLRHTVHASSALIIGGAALALAMGAAHGDLPEGSGAAALRFVADRPSYALVHFGSIIGVVLWTVGLRSSSALFDDTRARLVAQWASTVATIGAGVLAVQFSLDGFGLPAMADRFAAADLAARATLAEVAEVTADAMVGLALMWVIMLYGLAVSLLAAATLLDASVHRWLGFAGLAVGVDWRGLVDRCARRLPHPRLARLRVRDHRRQPVVDRMGGPDPATKVPSAVTVTGPTEPLARR